jgi:hypothetical protein
MSKPTLGQLLGDPGHTPKSAAEDARVRKDCRTDARENPGDP